MKSYEERTKDNAQKIAAFQVKQKLPYEFKIKYAEVRVREFIRECDKRSLNTHISVGGLDSITLLKFIHDYCGFSYVPGVSVSSLEDRSIQQIHEQLGVIKLSPYKSKIDIIREYGFPVLSKEIAAKIELLAHPTDKNKTDGTKYGWGRVLDYIGVGWRDKVFDMKNNQISFMDLEEEQEWLIK